MFPEVSVFPPISEAGCSNAFNGDRCIKSITLACRLFLQTTVKEWVSLKSLVKSSLLLWYDAICGVSPSIYPSIVFCLSEIGLWGNRSRSEFQTSCSPATSFMLFWEGLRCSQAGWVIYSPSSEIWDSLGVSSHWGMLSEPPMGGTLRASWSDTQTTSPNSFQCREAVALPWASSECQTPSVILVSGIQNLWITLKAPTYPGVLHSAEV